MNNETVKVKFSVGCMAVYSSELDIPKEIKDDEEEVLKYIRDHLNDCSVEDLTFLGDLDPEDAVTMEDIKYIE